MNTNEAGKALIKSFEKCRLTAYLPTSKDRWTIGWGHTGDVKPGMVITQHQADVIFDHDLSVVEGKVAALAPGATENQFAALVCLAFNIGTGHDGLGGSHLLAKLNAGDVQGAAAEFVKWDHQAGVELDGLKRRRLAERDLFLT